MLLADATCKVKDAVIRPWFGFSGEKVENGLLAGWSDHGDRPSTFWSETFPDFLRPGIAKYGCTWGEICNTALQGQYCTDPDESATFVFCKKNRLDAKDEKLRWKKFSSSCSSLYLHLFASYEALRSTQQFVVMPRLFMRPLMLAGCFSSKLNWHGASICFNVMAGHTS